MVDLAGQTLISIVLVPQGIYVPRTGVPAVLHQRDGLDG